MEVAEALQRNLRSEQEAEGGVLAPLEGGMADITLGRGVVEYLKSYHEELFLPIHVATLQLTQKFSYERATAEVAKLNQEDRLL